MTIGGARRGRDSRDSRHSSREIQGQSGTTGWRGMVRHGVAEICLIDSCQVASSGLPSSGSQTSLPLQPQGFGSERQQKYCLLPIWSENIPFTWLPSSSCESRSGKKLSEKHQACFGACWAPAQSHGEFCHCGCCPCFELSGSNLERTEMKFPGFTKIEPY